MGGGQALALNEELHVVPADDDRKHSARFDCWCEPDVSVDTETVAWMHHAHSLLCVPANQIALRTWRRRTRPP